MTRGMGMFLSSVQIDCNNRAVFNSLSKVNRLYGYQYDLLIWAPRGIPLWFSSF